MTNYCYEIVIVNHLTIDFFYSTVVAALFYCNLEQIKRYTDCQLLCSLRMRRVN